MYFKAHLQFGFGGCFHILHTSLTFQCPCETQLLSFSHEPLDNLHSGIQTEFIILDFSKAFDKVSHRKLLRKLNNYGIRVNTWERVSAFLGNRMQ